MNEISWNVDEQTYRESNIFSYSLLAKYERGGFSALQSLQEREESQALTFGSIVDCMLTDPNRFDKDYFVADFPALSDTMLQIANELKIYGGSNCNDDNILIVANKFEYGKNWKPETRIKSIREKCEKYLMIDESAEGRTIIDAQTYNEAISCMKAIHDHPEAKRYFLQYTTLEPFSKDIEYVNYYQQKFKATLNGITYKCMFDCLHVNNKDKTIQPVDLKTTGKPEWEFAESFIKWSYSIQARLYYRILKECIKGTKYADYKVLPFKFVVINKTTLTPLVWEYADCSTMGTLEYNNDVVLRDPFEIAEELAHYLLVNPKVPDGISENGTNNLVNYLNLKK